MNLARELREGDGPEPFAHPAATLLLLRDGSAGLEVLMITRHETLAFAGALAFPGGRIDAADRDLALLAHSRGTGAATDAAARIAAIRESYEETHILIARAKGDRTLLTARGMAAQEDRAAARLGRAPHFADLLADGGIEPATDLLVPFAHWITPKRWTKRFDTLFFLAPAPAGQEPAHDGREAVEALWIRPADAVAEADAARRSLVFATRLTLMKLARSPDVATALAAAAAETDRIAPITPEIYDAPDGPHIRIPPGLGYDLSDMALKGVVKAR